MVYQGITPMRYSNNSSIKIYEFDNSYVITTFKIGTRALESANPNNSFDFNTSINESGDLFDILKKDKSIIILIKNPVERFLSGGVQVTFESASENTAAYSLARWGSEDYYFTTFLKKFVKNDISDSSIIYRRDFDLNNLKPFDESIELWKEWLSIVNFNIRIGNGHLSYYHRDCFQNLYKLISSIYDVRIIEDIEMRNIDTFKEVTGKKYSSENFSNSIWKSYLRDNIIDHTDNISNLSYINPLLITNQSISIQKYLNDEYAFYGSFKKLIK